ncbi:MAG TPA: CRTAC1 family protein [Planctomycetota bacterium]|nr:CRTAC1 family protein [Planctomycetota bacterium]
MRFKLLSLTLLFAFAVAACEGEKEAPKQAPSAIKFQDVTAASGITFSHHYLDSESGSHYQVNPYDHGSGVAIADVDGDGKDDIYFCDFLGPNALYRNLGGMRFEDITAKAGVAVDRSLSVGAAFGDCDGDGDPDLYVTSYRGGNRLFSNKGDGTFEDITEKAGVGYVGHSNGATWFDCDNDGDLDLYVCNIGKFTKDTVSQEAEYAYAGVALPFAQVASAPDARNAGEADILYVNQGNATFRDETKQRGIDSGEWNGDVSVSDIDRDGDLDFYTSNMFGTNHLFENKGAGQFREITDSSLVRTSWGGMGARFFDANDDEWPDLYVVDMHSDMWTKQDSLKEIEGKENEKFNTPLGTSVGGGKVVKRNEDSQSKSTVFGNTFFENQGGLKFVERSREAGLENWWPWGIAVGDFDNDGHEDLYVPMGMGFPFPYKGNQLLHNEKGVFKNISDTAGLEPPQGGQTITGKMIGGKPMSRSSRAAAVADFDQDGDLDIIVANFNAPPYLLRNDSPPQHALRLKLVDPNGRPSFGARVRVAAGNRVIHRELANAGGYLTQSSAILHIGIGAATKVDRIDVDYPGGPHTFAIENPALGEVVRVVRP